jgi:protein ImuB
MKVHLRAEPARPRAAQNGIFQPPSPEPEKLELTLARIANIVGENKVGSLEVLDTHRPEGFRMQHFTQDESNGASLQGNRRDACPPSSRRDELQIPRSARDDNSSGDLVTALRIFRPALMVTVTMREGRPLHIACKKRKERAGEILWAAGPWRSSGDWWEQDGWARDEWDIAVQEETSIALYRLVHDLLSGRWLLEGEYD